MPSAPSLWSTISSMSDWHWQDRQGRPYLTCDLLSPWPHGFFTRHWSPATPEEINQALAPQAPVYRLKQVHGDRIVMTPPLSSPSGTLVPETEPEFPAADGLVARRPQQSIWVAAADCVPALIGDRRLGTTAAVHAGWRGTAQRILPLAVSKLLQAGSQLADLRVALGPAIAGEVYQVSTAVAARVGATVVTAPAAALDSVKVVSVAPPGSASSPDAGDSDEGNPQKGSPEAAIQAVLHQLTDLPRSPLLTDPAPDRVRLDVRRVNQLQLEQLGLSPQQITVAPHCTFADQAQFFSYRREALKKVQWSGIVSL
ncbi:MAG: peptidoglycan editing factor PgeF [Cyanobacteria bacterium P01_A01_bin.135]